MPVELNYRPMLKWAIRQATLRKWRKRRANDRARRAALALLDQFPRHAGAPRHGLPGELVVSLTSYPARFPTLHLTIRSLLDQTIRPDRIVLWIAHDDAASLPREVSALEGDVFTIRQCEDIRSFKKIIPSLLNYPDAFIVIADDDTYYSENWLHQLTAAFDPGAPTIVCHRAHQIRYADDGRLASYRQWGREVAGVQTERPRTDLLPTGNGGVLYPPGSLPPQTTDLDMIRRLCATCDDVWLYFMWRQTGWRVKRAPGKRHRFIEWPNTQEQSLNVFHKGGMKDEHLQAMSDHFGVP